MKKRMLVSLIFILCFAFVLVNPSYATTLFQDGFESGDFSAWTATATSNGGLSVVSTYNHHGTYSALSSMYGTYSISFACYRKNLSPSNNFYVRLYFLVDKLPPNNRYLGAFIVFREPVNNQNCEQVAIYNDNGDYKIHVRRLVNGGSTFEIVDGASINLNTSTWYCLEFHVLIDSTNGKEEVWLDGNQVFSSTGRNNTGLGTTRNSFWAGINTYSIGGANWGTPFNVYVDCVVVADTYIGPETARQWNNVASWTLQLITRQWTLVGTWTQTLITRAWQLTAEWNIQLITRVWQQINQWSLTLQALGWHLITAWTWTLQTLQWHNIASWTTSIITRAWQTIAQWTIYLGKIWHDIVAWTVNINIPVAPETILALAVLAFILAIAGIALATMHRN